MLQSRRIVHTVTCHANSVVQLAQALHDQILVLRIGLGETIGRQESVTVISAQVLGLLFSFLVQERKAVGCLYAVAHVQNSRGLHGDEQVIAGDHLHCHAVLLRQPHCVLGVGTGRIQESQQAHHPPDTALVGLGHSDGSDAALAQVRHILLDLPLQLSIATASLLHQLQQHLRGSLAGLELLAVVDLLALVPNGSLGALDHRIEGQVVQLLDAVHGLQVHTLGVRLAAKRSREYCVSPGLYAGVNSWMCISFRVRVPVLSEHKIAMPAISSIAAKRVTMAPYLVNSLEPRARVVVVTISMAIGIEATIKTTTKDRASMNGTMVIT